MRNLACFILRKIGRVYRRGSWWDICDETWSVLCFTTYLHIDKELNVPWEQSNFTNCNAFNNSNDSSSYETCEFFFSFSAGREENAVLWWGPYKDGWRVQSDREWMLSVQFACKHEPGRGFRRESGFLCCQSKDPEKLLLLLRLRSEVAFEWSSTKGLTEREGSCLSTETAEIVKERPLCWNSLRRRRRPENELMLFVSRMKHRLSFSFFGRSNGNDQEKPKLLKEAWRSALGSWHWRVPFNLVNGNDNNISRLLHQCIWRDGRCLYLSLCSSNAKPFRTVCQTQIYTLRARDLLEVQQIGCQTPSSRQTQLNPETLVFLHDSWFISVHSDWPGSASLFYQVSSIDPAIHPSLLSGGKFNSGSSLATTTCESTNTSTRSSRG